MKFREFQKIARLNRGMIVTEKLDGTNASVFIVKKEDINLDPLLDFVGFSEYKIAENDTHIMFAGSRTRWITPEKDNYGFAKWVKTNSEQLFGLGEGQHFGEWWGNGIQRTYRLEEKRFSLFNTGRWTNLPEGISLPSCCSLVPILYNGPFDNTIINNLVENLKNNGSIAVPGFMNPKGIIIFHIASRTLYKVTCVKDETPKGLFNENS